MTDQNRGAYTPQSDAPLSFDARRAGGQRGPMPITLIFSALILLALVVGGGIAVLYHNGSRKAGEAPQPVGEVVGDTRAPSETAANAAPATVVTGPIPGTAPTFTAPPEQPAARPVEAATPPPPPPPPAVAAATPSAPSASPVTAPAPKIVEATPKVAAPAVKTANPTAAPKVEAKAAAPATGAALVQIGAFSSTAQADAGWNEVARLMPGEMAGRTKVIEKLDRDGKTLYRTMIGGFASHKDAERLCLALLSKGRDCSVK